MPGLGDHDFGLPVSDIGLKGYSWGLRLRAKLWDVRLMALGLRVWNLKNVR